MDRRQFWKFIDASRRKANGDMDAQVEALHKELRALTAAEVVEFQELFDQYWIRAYRWDLWGAAYIIGGGCSDDGFMDFRAWLIAKGEKAYEEALKDAESLVNIIMEEDEDCQFEGFQYAASQVWEEKTGKEMAEFPRKELKHPTSPAGDQWSEEGNDLKQRFPKLWKKSGGECSVSQQMRQLASLV